MKKYLMVAGLLTTFLFPLKSQDFEQGDFQFKAGIGGPNWAQLALNVAPNGNIDRDGLMIMPRAKLDFFVHEKFAIGAAFDYQKTASDIYSANFTYKEEDYSGTFAFDRTRFTFTLHGEYHPSWFANTGSQIDLYVGGLVGVRSIRSELIAESTIAELNAAYDYIEDLGVNPRWLDKDKVKQRFGLYAGVQFPITGPLGAFVETGIGVPTATFGLKAHF